MTPLTNGAIIDAEIAWFEEVLDRRLRIYAGAATGDPLADLPPPAVPDAALPYAVGLRQTGLSGPERLVLILSALPHLRPHALDSLLLQNEQTRQRHTEFGGTGTAAVGFQPTRETALFLLSGTAMDQRLEAMALFRPDGALSRHGMLAVDDSAATHGPWQPLAISERWIALLTHGRSPPPQFGAGFPARAIVPTHRLDELVLDRKTRDELDDIVMWIADERRLIEGLGLDRHVKPGYRALFHGPPGTGKTAAAGALGEATGLPVYRVDLSRVVSKWIGETEKNLGLLFDQAADGEMVLFFDEADALFGKRGATENANDRHANQQIAYLLQRIEDCPGVVILASNLRSNIDTAFARRFQAVIHFAAPDAKRRLALWQAAFAPPRDRLVNPQDLKLIARQYEVTGGEIVNVLRHVGIRFARQNDDRPLSCAALEAAVVRELANAGRPHQ